MKIKTILFFAFFVFIVSCAPQVTATPEATVTLPPVSTPTLHPDFIALQESIAASSGRFSLHADGQLYDGDTPIPGVIVMPDGKMVLTVDGDKEIILERDGYDFDDEEGFTVKGMKYDEDTGAWVEAMSEAMQTAIANFDKFGFVFDEDKYYVDDKGDVFDVATEKMVCSAEGEFVLEFVQPALAAIDDLKETSYEPEKGNVPAYTSTSEVELEYLLPMMAEWREQKEEVTGVDPYIKGKSSYTAFMIDPETLAWGAVWFDAGDKLHHGAWQVLIFRNTNGEVVDIPLYKVNPQAVNSYWMFQ